RAASAPSTAGVSRPRRRRWSSRRRWRRPPRRHSDSRATGPVTLEAVFVFDPTGAALVLLLIAVYVRAVTVLRWRGYEVPRGQQVLYYSGTALIAIALLGPP